MAIRTPKPQPATKEKTCQVCGEKYTYTEPGIRSTRFHCELCTGLSDHAKKILGRMAKRITTLEKKLTKTNQPSLKS